MKNAKKQEATVKSRLNGSCSLRPYMCALTVRMRRKQEKETVKESEMSERSLRIEKKHDAKTIADLQNSLLSHRPKSASFLIQTQELRRTHGHRFDILVDSGQITKQEDV